MQTYAIRMWHLRLYTTSYITEIALVLCVDSIDQLMLCSADYFCHLVPQTVDAIPPRSRLEELLNSANQLCSTKPVYYEPNVFVFVIYEGCCVFAGQVL